MQTWVGPREHASALSSRLGSNIFRFRENCSHWASIMQGMQGTWEGKAVLSLDAAGCFTPHRCKTLLSCSCTVQLFFDSINYWEQNKCITCMVAFCAQGTVFQCLLRSSHISSFYVGVWIWIRRTVWCLTINKSHTSTKICTEQSAMSLLK